MCEHFILRNTRNLFVRKTCSKDIKLFSKSNGMWMPSNKSILVHINLYNNSIVEQMSYSQQCFINIDSLYLFPKEKVFQKHYNNLLKF
jgi:hypothetical protein